MNFNKEVFKAYDIRGLYNVDFDDNFAYTLGLAYSTLIKKELNKDKIQIVVGEDMRLSSPKLKEKLIQGLIDSGIDVIDIGLSSTPTFYFAVANYDYDGGIIVSASHNPKEYNGFKLVRNKALPIGKDTGIFEIRDIALNEEFSISETKGTVITKDDVLFNQVEYDLGFADIKKIEDLKIVIDTANSMGALYFDELFKYLLNCDLVKMNWELDGTFPAHEADPLKEENMEDLRKKVIEEQADLGISTDGDGDRIFFVDNKGDLVEPGIVRAILSKIFLKEKPNSKIAYDIRPGKITEDTILENGGTPIVTPVGHSLIKAQSVKEGAYFAGESSGHFFLNMDIGCFEVPVIVTLKILQELKDSGKTFAEYIDPFKKYFHSGEINSVVESKEEVFKKLEEKYSDAKINKLDGITVEYKNFWFNVRGSNTEPKIRLNLEARTRDLMEEKRNEVLGIIKS